MKKRSFEEIQVGEKTTFSKTITEADIFAFCGITGDFNPLHVDAEFAKGTMFKQRVAHGMLTAGLIDNTLTALGGLGTVHLSQTVRFMAPVFIGDTVTVQSEVAGKDPVKNRFTVKTVITNQGGKVVIEGEAQLLIPRPKEP